MSRSVPLTSSFATTGAIVRLSLAALLVLLTAGRAHAANIGGTVRQSTSPFAPIPNARMTVFKVDTSFFAEARSMADGTYSFAGIPPGSYRLGSAALGRAYQELALAVSSSDLVRDFSLPVETHPGSWQIIGSTSPENLYATDSGTLLPDGRIFYCHDTMDPILFDPVTGASSLPPGSNLEQGCHTPTVLLDGRLLFVGGQESEDFREATKQTKVWNPSTGVWTRLADLTEERWYPGLVRLSDGRLLAMGGGQSPSAQRTPTCEIWSPETNQWTVTGSMSQAADFPPSVLLMNGEVLRSWYPPQRFNVTTGQWRDTGLFVQPNRFWPGHCDHSLVLLEDGRAVACGILRGNLTNPSMLEIYDPTLETWSLGATPAVTRSYPEVVLLPTGHLLTAGGALEDANPNVPTNAWGQVFLTDLYDPIANSWRSMDDLNWAREYHALAHLVPDGRVILTAGTGGPAQPGISNDVEAFSPPYLFRGVRPRIDAISSLDLARGASVELQVSLTSAVTKVVLIGTGAVTHWVDAGIPRLVSLPYTQVGGTVTLQVPTAPEILPLGFYMLFAFVDDIPSEARIVRVLPAGPASVPPTVRVQNEMRILPNPVRESTALSWLQSSGGPVLVHIIDAGGRSVWRSQVETRGPGWYSTWWTGRDDSGVHVAPGSYWARVTTPSGVLSRRLVVVR